ncbi:hypothetical protein ACFQ0B_33830 [Nonomuraea thailandensis]
MRRHRLGTIATFVVALYVIAAIAAGVVTLVTGKLDAVWWAVLREPPLDRLPATWWVLLLLLPVVAVQGWAYRQILRGPARGGPQPRERRVTLLRWTLYLNAAWSMLPYSVIPWTWWQGVLGSLLQLATVVLYFTVLRCSRWLRPAVLAGGSLCALAGLAESVADGLGHPAWSLPVMRWTQLSWPAWMLPVLLAQARDPRFSRATVWLGVLSVTTSLVHPSVIMTSWTSDDELPVEELIWTLFRGVSVFGPVWQARSAHDLASPPPAPRRVPPGRRPGAGRCPRWPSCCRCSRWSPTSPAACRSGTAPEA